MRLPPLLLIGAALAVVATLAVARSLPPHKNSTAAPTLILVSLDGFTPAYLQRGVTPTLQQLVDTGVHAPYVVTSFATKTFPNHWTIVTGLYPESHGIVSNTIYDPVFDETFTISNPDAVTNAKWWGGEPVWNTLMKNGLKTAAYFWPGSEADVQGMRPTYYKAYDGSVPNSERVDGVIEWLLLPADQRPNFVTLYFSTVDDYGHQFGPSSPRMDIALQIVDQNIKQLVSELERYGLRDMTDIVVVSDHGMSAISEERVLYLEDYVDTRGVDVIEVSPVGALIPLDPADEPIVYAQLLEGAQRDGHFIPYWKNGTPGQQTPERLHYMDNIRIAPILIVMDDGWTMVRARGDHHRHDHGSTRTMDDSGGDHGYDNTNASMYSLFIANGPSFRVGELIDPFPNVEVYNLLCAVYDAVPAPNNGTVNSALIQQALAR